MKINFWYPNKENDTIVKMNVKLNYKYVFEFTYKGIIWKLVNCTNIKSVVVVGSIDNGKNYYWCNTILFSSVFTKFPFLRREEDKISKKGIHKRILEAVFQQMGIIKQLESYNIETFKKYIKEEYRREL